MHSPKYLIRRQLCMHLNFQSMRGEAPDGVAGWMSELGKKFLIESLNGEGGTSKESCPPESGGQRHHVLCDDARGGSPIEMFQNAFITSVALEPPPARSRLLSRSCCPPDSGGPFGWLQHLQCLPVVGSTNVVKTGLDGW